MIEKYRDEILQSFLEKYYRMYLIDLEKDTIVKIYEAEDAPQPDPVTCTSYSEFNRRYSLENLDPEYSEWRRVTGSIESIRRKLTERSNYTLSYPMRDGTWMKVDNRVVEKKDGVPVKAVAGVYSEENELISVEYSAGQEQPVSLQMMRQIREEAYKDAIQHDAVSTFEINVTRNRVVSSNILNSDLFYHVDGIDIPGPLDVHSNYWETRILSDNRKQFREFCKKENLIAMYEMGERDPWIEYLVKDRLGNRFWLREIISLSKSKVTGDILGVIILKDMTERKKIEIENARRLDLIMGLAKDYESVFFVDLDTDSYDIYRRNERVAQKYSRVFMTGFSDSVEAFAYMGVCRQDRENFIKQLSIDSLRNVLDKKSGFSFTFRTGNTGAPRYYRAKGVRIGRSGSIQMLLGFANIDEEWQEDLRIRKLLEDALEQARHADDAKNTFLSNMSHDIRTPMNAIVGFANIAAAHIDDRGKVLDSLDKILVSSNHLLHLINNVLDMSRIESGRMVLEESWVSLREIIKEVTDLMKPEILARKHEYEIRVAESVPDFVLCDKLRMTQLLLNLLSNAVKYTPPQGRIRLTVDEGLGAPEGYSALEFVISDTGIGMSRDFQKRIFEPFERENNSTVSKVMGSGLGMPICKGIVDTMGGSLTIDSQQGRGSVITVSLALKSEQDADQDSEMAERTTEQAARESGPVMQSKTAIFIKKSEKRFTRKEDGKYRVLVVEDNELNREIAKEILLEGGYLVDTAEDGETAIVKIGRSDRNYYDAVLMDIQMPGIDGYEAARSIRRMYDIDHAQIPIIAMTANAFDEDMEKARSAGMNGYIAKPVEPEVVQEILKQILVNEEEY